MPLDADGPHDGETRAVPARMLNEFAFCPRLFYLEWVQAEFQDNRFTVEGRFDHRRVDRGGGEVQPPEAPAPFKARAVALSSERLGLSGRIDLVEGEGGQVVPVDYKRGRPPDLPERCHEPERVQLCAYGLLLRDHGYACEGGALWFAGSKERVDVPFDDALVARTLQLLGELRRVMEGKRLPPPLRGSPKCDGCSLAGLCLPDEVNFLAGENDEADDNEDRRILPARDDASPLYVRVHGARVGLAGDVLEVRDRDRGKLGEAKLFDTSQVVVLGNVQVTTQAVHELCNRAIPIAWLSQGGWFYGMTDGLGSKNVELRLSQYRAAEDLQRSLALARRFVRAKIANCRTVLRRNAADLEPSTLDELAATAEKAVHATRVEELLGHEGNAARIYYGSFARMLRPPDVGGAMPAFDFRTRNRRPPRDPVNALLSFAYALLAKEFSVAARAVGFDPFLGFYHQPRYGRPALALDLMEEFRPIIGDSVVLSVVNTGVVSMDDFDIHPLGVSLRDEGKKRFLRAYERRMDELVTHPVFGYRISYRRVLEVQCRLLGRHLMGELPEFPEFRTR